MAERSFTISRSGRKQLANETLPRKTTATSSPGPRSREVHEGDPAALLRLAASAADAQRHEMTKSCDRTRACSRLVSRAGLAMPSAEGGAAKSAALRHPEAFAIAPCSALYMWPGLAMPTIARLRAYQRVDDARSGAGIG